MHFAVTRRYLTMAALGAVALAGAHCGHAPKASKPARKAPQRVFVIGFDGMDPTLARKFMDEGKLPNLKALARRGRLPHARLAPSPRSRRRPGRASPPA